MDAINQNGKRCNQWVAGSIPVTGSINKNAGVKQEDANEDRFKDRNNARDKNGYCCKAHEQRIRRKKDKRISNDQMDKAARKMDERDQ